MCGLWLGIIISSCISILVNPFMQGVHNYMPEKKSCFYGIHCCSCSVFTICATRNVISPVKYVLYFYISTFRSRCATPNMDVFLFCSSLISCFPGMLLRYCLSDSEMVPVAPIITGINFAFTVHMRWMPIMLLYYYYYYYYSVLDVLKFVAETSVKSPLRNYLKNYNVKRSFVRTFV